MKKQALKFATVLTLVVTLLLTAAVPSANAQHGGGMFDWFFNIFSVEPSVSESESPAPLTCGCVFDNKGQIIDCDPCAPPVDDYLW